MSENFHPDEIIERTSFDYLKDPQFVREQYLIRAIPGKQADLNLPEWVEVSNQELGNLVPGEDLILRDNNRPLESSYQYDLARFITIYQFKIYFGPQRWTPSRSSYLQLPSEWKFYRRLPNRAVALALQLASFRNQRKE